MIDKDEYRATTATAQQLTEINKRNDTLNFWSGDFGTAYTARNRVDWRARIPFWDRLVAKYGFRSVYEVGCNAGWNLSAIRHSIHGYNVQSYGCDVNRFAVAQAKAAGFEVKHGTVDTFEDDSCVGMQELSFTSGVLIHVAPDDIKKMMQAVIDASCDYVLSIEYEDETEVEVEYRGHAGKLWRRPYGKLYQEMGLELIETGKLGEEDGFDKNGITYWLLRKP